MNKLIPELIKANLAKFVLAELDRNTGIHKGRFPFPFKMELYTTRLVNPRWVRVNDEKDPVKLYEKQTYLFATLRFANQDEIDSFRKELATATITP